MFLSNNHTELFISKINKHKPAATAKITGSENYPKIKGTVSFYPSSGGTLVVADISGLPRGPDKCGERVFAFHIHEGGKCSGNKSDPFAAAGGHYNPNDCPHPQHAGDLPPLFGNDGFAWSGVFTDRFTVKDIIGKAVIIHKDPDDFTTQPSGNSGEKIACGIIKKA